MSDSITTSLKMLSSNKDNVIAIITGQPKEKLSRLMKIKNLLLCAEKGAFVRWPGKSTWEKNPDLPDSSWKILAFDLVKDIVDRTDGSWIDTSPETALVWHYELADPDYGKLQAEEMMRKLS
eukprot:UN23574